MKVAQVKLRLCGEPMADVNLCEMLTAGVADMGVYSPTDASYTNGEALAAARATLELGSAADSEIRWRI